MIRLLLTLSLMLSTLPAAVANTQAQTLKQETKSADDQCLYSQIQGQKEVQKAMSVQANKDDLGIVNALIQADKNGDKKLSIKEAVHAGMDNLFLKIDVNRDRFIEPFEVNLWLKQRVVDQIWKEFRRSDRDQSNTLSNMEVVFKMPDMAPQFKQADKDNSGEISFSETVAFFHPEIAKSNWFQSLVKRKGLHQ